MSREPITAKDKRKELSSTNPEERVQEIKRETARKIHDPLKGLHTGYITAFVACAFLTGSLVWASFSNVETAIHAEGTVVPVGMNRRAQYLEGGIVSELLVKEGEQVKAGEVLVRIAPEQAQSALGQRKEKINSLKAQIARLTAEQMGDRTFVPVNSEIAWQTEAQAFKANQQALNSRIQTYKEQETRSGLDAQSKQAQFNGLKQQEIPLSKSVSMQQAAISAGGGSPGRLIEAQSQLAAVRAQMAGIPSAIEADQTAQAEARARATSETDNLRADSSAKLAAAQAELSALIRDTESASDRVNRTEVRSPVQGIIQKLYVNDVGEVVPPNSTVAEIVPTGDGLVIEAKVRPEDMRGLRPGMHALVRMSAYDVSRFGTLSGTVLSLAPDISKDEKTGQVYYRIRIKSDNDQIGGEPVRIGMQASVDVITGDRTVLQYLIAPVVDWSTIALKDR